MQCGEEKMEEEIAKSIKTLMAIYEKERVEYENTDDFEMGRRAGTMKKHLSIPHHSQSNLRKTTY